MHRSGKFLFHCLHLCDSLVFRSLYVPPGSQGLIFAANSGSNKTGVIRKVISVAATLQRLYFPELSETVLAAARDVSESADAAAGARDSEKESPADIRYFCNKVRLILVITVACVSLN